MPRFVLASILTAALLPAFAFSQSDTTAQSEPSESTESESPELRKPRTWALSAEIGMNSLSSLLGPVATWYVTPRYAVDFGAGLSSVGLRPGVRGRYLFSLEKTAYFAALGLKYGLGSADQYVEVKDPHTDKELEIKIDGCGFIDASVGVEYVADNGFQVIANAGYSQLWGGRNYHYRQGSVPSDKGDKAFETIFGSGIMLSVALGKAF